MSKQPTQAAPAPPLAQETLISICSRVPFIAPAADRLLKDGKDPTLRNSSGGTPLHVAINAGSEAAVAWCLNTEAVFKPIIESPQDNHGQTPLFAACKLGDFGIFVRVFDRMLAEERLFSKWIRVRSKDQRSVLHAAASGNSEGHEKILAYLCEKRPDVIQSLRDVQEQSLLQACKRGALRIAAVLLEKAKIEADILSPDGCSIIHMAVESGNEEMVKWACEHAEKLLSTPNKAQFTPLYAALTAEKWKIVQILLPRHKEAELRLIPPGMPSVLHAVVSRRDHTMLEQFLQLAPVRQALLNSQEEKSGATPLHIACLFGPAKMVQHLIQHGAKSQILDKEGRTPLQVAVANEMFDVVEHLLKFGLRHHIQVLDADGDSPYTTAAKKGSLRMAEKLLVEGANPFIGKRPLQDEISQGFIKRAQIVVWKQFKSTRSNPKDVSQLKEAIAIIDDDGTLLKDDRIQWNQLPALKCLHLCDCQLDALTEPINAPNLQTLYLDGNQLRSLPKWLAELPLAHVSANRNRIDVVQGVPPTLVALSVSHNLLPELPSNICQRQLEFLDVSHNKITDLSAEGNALAAVGALVHLRVEGNDLSQADLLALKKFADPIDYYRERRLGQEPPYTVRVLLLGDKDAGKTTLRIGLSKRVGLIGRYGSISDKKRKTITPLCFEVDVPPEKYPQSVRAEDKRLRLTLTDPPGDLEVQPAVQHFVCAQRTIILLVVNVLQLRDTATTDGESGAEAVCRRWLSLIQDTVRLSQLGAEVPSVHTILAATHQDELEKEIKNPKEREQFEGKIQTLVNRLREAYPLANLKFDFLYLNALENRNIDEVWRRVSEVACDLTIRSNIKVPPYLNDISRVLREFIRHPRKQYVLRETDPIPETLSASEKKEKMLQRTKLCRRKLRYMRRSEFLKLLGNQELGRLDRKKAEEALMYLQETGHIIRVRAPKPREETKSLAEPTQSPSSKLGATADDSVDEWIVCDPAWFGMVVCCVMSPFLVRMSHYPDEKTRATFEKDSHPKAECYSGKKLCECLDFDSGEIEYKALVSELQQDALNKRLKEAEQAESLNITNDEEAQEIVEILVAMEVLVRRTPSDPNSSLFVPSRLPLPSPTPLAVYLNMPAGWERHTIPLQFDRIDADSTPSIKDSKPRPLHTRAPSVVDVRSMTQIDHSRSIARFHPNFMPQLLAELPAKLAEIDPNMNVFLSRNCIEIVNPTSVGEADRFYSVRLQMNRYFGHFDLIATYLVQTTPSSSTQPSDVANRSRSFSTASPSASPLTSDVHSSTAILARPPPGNAKPVFVRNATPTKAYTGKPTHAMKVLQAVILEVERTAEAILKSQLREQSVAKPEEEKKHDLQRLRCSLLCPECILTACSCPECRDLSVEQVSPLKMLPSGRSHGHRSRLLVKPNPKGVQYQCSRAREKNEEHQFPDCFEEILPGAVRNAAAAYVAQAKQYTESGIAEFLVKLFKEEAPQRALGTRNPLPPLPRYDEVFISHSGTDKPSVVPIFLQLLGLGCSSFLDKLSMGASELPFDEQIENAIDQCPVFLAIVGVDYFHKQWCCRELRYALSCQNKIIIPIILNAVTFKDNKNGVKGSAIADAQELSDKLTRRNGYFNYDTISYERTYVHALQLVLEGLGIQPLSPCSLTTIIRASAEASGILFADEALRVGNRLLREPMRVVMEQEMRRRAPGTLSFVNPAFQQRLEAPRLP